MKTQMKTQSTFGNRFREIKTGERAYSDSKKSNFLESKQRELYAEMQRLANELWKVRVAEFLILKMGTYEFDAWRAVEHLDYPIEIEKLKKRLRAEGMTPEEEKEFNITLMNRSG